MSRPLHDWLYGAILMLAAVVCFLSGPAWACALFAVLAVATVAVPAVLRRRLAARERELG